MVTQTVEPVVEESKASATGRKLWTAPQVITSVIEQGTAKTVHSAGSERHTSTSPDVS